MAANNTRKNTTRTLIEEGLFKSSIPKRNRRNSTWTRIYMACVALAAVALVILLLKIIDDAFGYIAIADVVDPASLVTEDGRILEEQTKQELAVLLRDTTNESGDFYVSTNRLFSVFLDDVSQTDVTGNELRDLTLAAALTNGQVYPVAWADRTVVDLRQPQNVDRAERDDVARADLITLIEENLDEGQLVELVFSDIVQFDLKRSWNFIESLTQQEAIQQFVAEEYPDARLEFYSWLNGDFLRSPSSSQALTAGIRVAILGTLWMLFISMAVSLPLGVGAAIYLEEYAHTSSSPNRLIRFMNGFIETNIRNLAGVPSIIYGMLGLAVFVRALESITSGRTILSAGLTMALLILPVIIINAQEAIRAVPQSVREGSYGLGATHWQTISRQVLPVALPGILTGVILSVSRAIGETAPLVVVGAATVIFTNPTGPLSKFTVLPIQIFRWTADPRAGFQDAAAATIIVLLTMLVALNATAIILRNYYSSKNRKLA
jgi:phosphate transport system permease protein